MKYKTKTIALSLAVAITMSAFNSNAVQVTAFIHQGTDIWALHVVNWTTETQDIADGEGELLNVIFNSDDVTLHGYAPTDFSEITSVNKILCTVYNSSTDITLDNAGTSHHASDRLTLFVPSCYCT